MSRGKNAGCIATRCGCRIQGQPNQRQRRTWSFGIDTKLSQIKKWLPERLNFLNQPTNHVKQRYGTMRWSTTWSPALPGFEKKLSLIGVGYKARQGASST
jgi:hypothetical protein